MSNYIYHYTTINSLALIFSNKTLRLNSLSNVDDMEEGHADIFGDMSKYVFVSSWTREEEENIALWNMYTPNMRGIRIGIDPKNILLEYGADDEVKNIKSYGSILCYSGKEFLSDVEYTEKNLVEIISKDGLIPNENIVKIGKLKKSLWSFQKEVRFILMGLPLSKVNNPHYISRKNWFYEKILKQVESNINFIDININDNVWENAEITLGPNTDLSDKRILSSLIKAYYPNSKIRVEKSSLKIRVKRF